MSCWRDERGFTLAELLTALAMLGLVLAGVVIIQQETLQAYVTGSNKTEVQQNARVALERMARDIRKTQSPLTAAAATSLTFVDPNTGLAVTYALGGNTPNFNLTRTTNGVTDIVIGAVRTLTFSYYAVNSPVALGVPVGTPGNVFRVDITIQTRSEDTVVAGGIADTNSELTTSVRLRNL
jgi:prepilin-type N-terminal cleavage/methylation domain-containing protein